MASNFDYSVSYPFDVRTLWSLISTEQYWHDLIERTNAEHGSVESFSHDGSTVTVATKQGVGAEELPSVVTAVRPGDVEIPRTIEFVTALPMSGAGKILKRELRDAHVAKDALGASL